jgi:hypothetical protein
LIISNKEKGGLHKSTRVLFINDACRNLLTNGVIIAVNILDVFVTDITSSLAICRRYAKYAAIYSFVQLELKRYNVAQI